MPDALSAPAPAKVNLTLEVLRKRDDGYHEIESVLQTLELGDMVTLAFDGGPRISVSGPYAAGTPLDESNLAWRAAAVLAQLTGNSVHGLSIQIEKRIPPAGGLGGGASDAATTLRLLQRAWPAVTLAELMNAANAVGSDEAFFLTGGTALARGRGDALEALPDVEPSAVVLLVPPFTLERKTARMFAALAGLPFDAGGLWRRYETAGVAPEAAMVANTFERVAFDCFAGLAALWEDLEGRTGQPIRLAGAGPTLFWIGRESEASQVAAMAEGAACAVIRTRTARSLWR